MKPAILIAVRLKSKRLPKKALTDIEGKTLIERLIKHMKLSSVRPIVLCTSRHPEDKILVEIAKKENIRWFAGDEDDVLLRFINAAEATGADTIVRITGDNPLTDHEILDKMVVQHLNLHPDYTYVEGLPEGTKPEVISVEALKKCHKLAENPNLSEYMTLYFKDSKMFKTHKIVASPELYRPQYRLTVDTEADLRLVREIFKQLGQRAYQLIEVVKLLDKNPGLAQINSHIKSKKVILKIYNGKLRIEEVVE